MDPMKIAHQIHENPGVFPWLFFSPLPKLSLVTLPVDLL